MCTDMRWIVLFSLLLLSKCLILAFGNISIQNHDSSIYKKSNCGKTLNSNESIKSDKSPNHCHSVCLFFTLLTFLCNLSILFYIQLYSMPPGFIRFALIRSFSYSIDATAFDDCQLLFFYI